MGYARLKQGFGVSGKITLSPLNLTLQPTPPYSAPIGDRLFWQGVKQDRLESPDN
jgi:hypothetical protein